MSLLLSPMAKNSSAGFYNGVATQSLRFDDGSSAYLTRTPSSAGNRRTFTFSAWVKRGPSLATTDKVIFDAGTGNAADFRIRLSDTNFFDLVSYNGSSYDFNIRTNQVFRDVSAWYHIVVAFDTTQGTAANRIKVYVNGTQVTSFSIATYPSENFQGFINSTEAHAIGRYTWADGAYFDGYMAEVNFIDGTALGPSSFGETKNGVWIPIDTSGLTFGTNGFRLKFDQVGVGTASTSTIGADTSGNTHHFTSSGIVASDCNMPDSPENNFCTLSSVAKSTGLTLSNGNLQTNTSNKFALGTIGVNSGKWYFENYINSTNGGFAGVYNADTGTYSTTIDDSGNNPSGYGYYSNGQKARNGSFVNYGSAFTTAGDIIGVALDMDNGAIYFSKNGTWQNSATTSEIAAGTTTNAAFTGLSGDMVARGGHYNNNNPTILNFGQDSSFAGAITAGTETPSDGAGVFKYAPPSGYLALCTANIPEPTIGPNSTSQADDHFESVLYEGDGSTQNIAVNFKPDWTWIKNRDATDSHQLFDSNRGVTNVLQSDTTTAEVANDDTLTAFISTGFSLGDDVAVNTNNESYVAWNWKANGGTTVTNEDGTIDSTVQANTDAGFSIITYTGTGVGGKTIGHGLSSAPDWIIIKQRGASVALYSWNVYHSGLSGNANSVALNNSNDATGDTNTFNNTAPTSSVFSLSNDAYKNITNHDGTGYVAYCFHSVEGYSKFGSYEGNAATDGAFVYLGFRPAFVLIKNADENGYNWYLYDNLRKPHNNNSKYLIPNTTGVETDYAGDSIDHLSNGFKLRTDANGRGTNRAVTFLYMAFAEAPFKYANAR